jgi:hypothetical protein
MPSVRTLATLFVAMSMRGGYTVPSVDQSSCRGPDNYSALVMSELRDVMHPALAADTAFRSMAGLPRVPDTTIALVTDSPTCARAVAAYNQIDTTQHASSMYVIQVDTVYVAFNPDAKAGEWLVNYVFDSAFRYISTFFL